MKYNKIRSEHIHDNAKLFANRFDALISWPVGGKIAEVGVAYGDFSKKILDIVKPELFDGYDIFLFHENEIAWGRDTSSIFNGKTHLEYYKNRFSHEMNEGVMRVFEGDGSSNLKKNNTVYDVIYLDASHTYEQVNKDIENIKESIKIGGLIVFNDYILYDHISKTEYGVVPVANKLCLSGYFKVKYFAFHEQMFCDIALERQF